MSDYIGYFTKELLSKTNGSKLARRIIRGQLRDKKNTGDNNIGPSKFTNLAPRKERRAAARKNKEAFIPQLNE